MTVEFIAHRFMVSDVDDPDIHAAQPLYEWQQSEAGKWMMENSNPTPLWERQRDNLTYGTRYVIKAYLTPKLHMYWKLKYD